MIHHRNSIALLGCLFAIHFSNSVFAMYDPGLGRFLSRDPIGHDESLSMYESQMNVNTEDPDGTQSRRARSAPENRVISIRPSNLNPKCDSPSAKATFRFLLDRWPCRGNKGYFVQKVSVYCHVAPCEPQSDGETFDSFTYFEAWPVNKPNRGSISSIDIASFSTSGRGRYYQGGKVKFFCLSPDNVRQNGEITVDETSSPGRNSFGNGPCKTSSGSLHSTDIEPVFWSRDGAAGTGHRTFGMNWNCCCGKLKFASAFARP